MKKNIFKILASLFAAVLFTAPLSILAQDAINLDAKNLLPKVEVFVTPRNSTFLVGSTFQAPIYIDTKGNNINAINLKINFDPKKLAVVNPSGGKSIFGIWVESPQYDNAKGTASLAGVVPGGITTSSGLVITMTFKVLSSGTTRVTISDQTTINANDGLGSEILINKSGATYTLQNVPPNGVSIYSDTHPSQDIWYNNNSPLFEWTSSPLATGYSVSFDNTAGSIPENKITNKETSAFYEKIKDGVWYLHVKTLSKSVWGATSHFKVHVDTVMPAEFSPTVDSFKDQEGTKKYMVSFFTTDTMSGIDHYEVGLINKKSLETASPVFVEAQSPYLAPRVSGDTLRVIIRAYDGAGNVRESHVDLYPGFTFVQMLKKIGIYLLILLVIILLLELILHYLFGHHILDHLKKAYQTFKAVSGDDVDGNIPRP